MDTGKAKTGIILLLLMYIIFLQQCKKPAIEYIKGENTIITRTSVIDTIPFNYPVPRYVNIPISEPTSTEVDTLDGSTINNYTLSVEDSLISGTLFSKVDGTLVSQKFEYIPKFPKFIKETVTITEKEQVKKRNLLFLTGIVEGNQNLFSPKLGLSLYQKKGYLYSLTYDPLNKQIGVGVGLQINNRK